MFRIASRDSMRARTTTSSSRSISTRSRGACVRCCAGRRAAARSRWVLPGAAGRADPWIRHRGITLDPVAHTVERGGEPVVLSAHEFSVLEALMQRPGTVLSRAQLEDRLYGWSDGIESNAVEVYVHGLRRKLGNDAI